MTITLPEEAREHWFTCGCGQPTCDRAGYTHDGVKLIVAAELRWMASRTNDVSTQLWLRQRADELEQQEAS